MKYFTWKLDWSDGNGVDPTALINSETVRIEPHFATGDFKDANTLVYAYLLKGELNLAELSQWSVKETTLEAVFAAAQLLDADSLIKNGVVKFPMLDYTNA